MSLYSDFKKCGTESGRLLANMQTGQYKGYLRFCSEQKRKRTENLMLLAKALGTTPDDTFILNDSDQALNLKSTTM